MFCLLSAFRRPIGRLVYFPAARRPAIKKPLPALQPARPLGRGGLLDNYFKRQYFRNSAMKFLHVHFISPFRRLLLAGLTQAGD